ncbi:MTOR [Cordylochernes scorpioides]|uniref:MTOR n=1 Tax=Cordylochernes scorpioides TaxID=51811 RepID=A0ABY6K8R5_9ARAC|nr:MTOR [Cordylochernes scorpioides]
MSQRLDHFVSGLRSRSEEVRLRAARDLHQFVTTELREMSMENFNLFMDNFNTLILEMVSSSDLNEKKGGILAIMNLIGVELGNHTQRVSRFANYLRNLLPSNDPAVMELTAHAVGRLAAAAGTYTVEYVEFEVKRAFEWLSGDRNEWKRHASVLVLRELAMATPTLFFQNMQLFFEYIFNVVRDPKPMVRDSAVGALRAALVVCAQRENKELQEPLWYRYAYEEAEKGFEEVVVREKGINKDDRIHGSLLIFNELLRAGNLEAEKIRQELEDITHQHTAYQEHSARHHLLLGSGSLTRGFKALHQLTSSHHRGGLSAVIRYHKAMGTFPGGTSTPTRRMPLIESSTCKTLVQTKFDHICLLALRHKNSRSIYVHHALIQLLSRLAAFQSQRFVRNYLGETMQYLEACLKREKERAQAFTAIGLVALAIQGEIRRYIPRVLEAVRTALPAKDVHVKKRSSAVVEPAVFACISLLGRSGLPELEGELRKLLEPMMATGLSPGLTAALQELCRNVPGLKAEIQEGLLRMLSYVLMHQPLQHPGMPMIATAHPPPYGYLQNLMDNTDNSNIILALKTLGSFDFHGRSLRQFVSHCAENYLVTEHKELRLEAVKTCCRLLQPIVQSAKQANRSPSTIRTVQEVLTKLLATGVSDPDSDVRYCVLASLDERFDAYLAEAENIKALFLCLHDETFEIRELALCTIGRLSSINPACVLPSLRKVLIEILSELEHSGVGRNKEQSTKMLAHLVASAPRLIQPYLEPILKALIPKLKEPDPNPGVTVSVLAAIGELSQVSGPEMRKWMDELLILILEMLQDSSSLAKREVSLWTLGQLVESTGYVVEPYQKHPMLLEILLSFLKTEQSPGIRREAIRVLGLLGALDPYKHKINLGLIDHSGESGGALSLDGPEASQGSPPPLLPSLASFLSTELAFLSEGQLNASDMLVNMSSGNPEDFYPAIALGTLMRIIHDPTLSQHHTIVVQSIIFIFKSLGIRCVNYVPQVMPSFIQLIRNSDPSIREFLFQQLGHLISIVKQHIRNYLPDIFDLIKEFWTVNTQMPNTIILVVEQLVLALGSEFRIYLPQLMPQILRVFLYDTTPVKSITSTLLTALQKFGPCLDDFLHLILPPVVKLFDAPDVPLPVKKLALETIQDLASKVDFTAYASRIIHPLVRCLENSDLRPVAMDTLCALIEQLGRRFVIFQPLVCKAVQKHRLSHIHFEALIERISKTDITCNMTDSTRLTPVDCSQEPGHGEEDDGGLPTTRFQNYPEQERSQDNQDGSAMIKKLPVSAVNIQRAWTATRKVSKEDWMEWMRRLSIELLKESPAPELRSCWVLAQSYHQLPRDLFNAAFLSCWTELNKENQDELVKNLADALTSQEIPEITQSLLNLAEFMEHCEKVNFWRLGSYRGRTQLWLGPMTLDPKLLGERALKCRAYAKALHYKEEEFHKGPDTWVLESLIRKTCNELAGRGQESYQKATR